MAFQDHIKGTTSLTKHGKTPQSLNTLETFGVINQKAISLDNAP